VSRVIVDIKRHVIGYHDDSCLFLFKRLDYLWGLCHSNRCILQSSSAISATLSFIKQIKLTGAVAVGKSANKHSDDGDSVCSEETMSRSKISSLRRSNLI